MSGVAKNGNFMVDYGFRLMESVQLELRFKIKRERRLVFQLAIQISIGPKTKNFQLTQ
jgi:hypothetical protein